jgi:PilZ domain
MKLFGGTKRGEERNGSALTANQRVEIKIRGVGRTSGQVAELDAESALIALVVAPAPDAVALQEPDAILEYTTLRGLYRQKGHARFNGDGDATLRFVGREEPELVQRREFVRVDVNIPVDVTLQGNPWPATFDALNLSANGILLAAPAAGVMTLRLGMFVWLKIPLYDGKDPIEVRGTAVREGRKGSVGIRFDHIAERDQERLARYVARQERRERSKGGV